MIYEFMAICFFGGMFVQTISGSCYEVTTVHNFNLTRFFGIWYEALRQDKVLGSKCDRYEYINDTTNEGCAFNIKRHAFTSQGLPFFDDLYGGWSDGYDPARFNVRNFYTNPTSTPTNFMILGTDYETFAIVYECYDRTRYEVPVKWGWLKLLTRERHAKKFTIDKGIKVIEENKIDSSKMWTTPRRGCKRWENDGR